MARFRVVIDGSSRRELAAGIDRARPAAALVFLVAAAIDLATMNRTVGLVDRGELAAVATTLGIAHPTGYPTLTLLGHVWVGLLPLEPALALNLLAALWAAAGAGLLTLLYDQALARVAGAGGGPAPAPGPRATLAAIGALLTALTGVWWGQAGGFEVYALQVLLLPLVVWRFLVWLEHDRLADGRWFAFVLGLAFTNHVTIGLLGPALLFLHFATRRPVRRAFADLLPLVPPFLLGLTPYLYLPIRAAQHPRFDWNAPVDLHHFLRHVTGREFRGWLFADADAFRRNAGWFIGTLPWEWAWGGLALIALGAFRLARSDRRLGAAAGLLIATGILWGGGYAIRDIEPDLLPAVLGFGLFAAAGLLELYHRAGGRAAVALGLAVAVASGALHWRDADESDNRLGERIAYDTLVPLPRDALLVTTQWDYGYSASLYYQTVRGLRPDVTVVDLLLLRNGWYLDELERRSPALVRAAALEAAAFRRELEPYDRGRPYDGARIEVAWRAMVEAVIARHADHAPVFVTWEIDSGVGAGFRRVPEHLACRLTRDTTYVAEAFPRYRFRTWPRGPDGYVATAHLIYARSLVARMAYEDGHGHSELARRYGRYALAFAPPWRPDQVGLLPYDRRELVLQSLQFFRAAARLVERPPGEPTPSPR